MLVGPPSIDGMGAVTSRELGAVVHEVVVMHDVLSRLTWWNAPDGWTIHRKHSAAQLGI